MRVDRENMEKLPELLSEIHDMWFDVHEITFDEVKHEFVLFFGATKDLYDHYLKVEGVRRCEIKDTEKVGQYDINYLSISLKKSTISIIGCITIRITLKVTPDFRIITGLK